MSEAFFESAQALLTGYDTAISKQWREEDRRWRHEDMEWRKQERAQMNLDADFIEDARHWRGQDIEQRVLDNARHMWSRFVEKNRRAVEERAEQLKSISNLAALIAGFALIAFLEFSVDVGTTPRGLVLSFGLTTALTVGLMVNSMVKCSLMHASILKTGKHYVSEEDEVEFIFRCRQYAKGYRLGERPPSPARSFEIHWDLRCEAEWRNAFNLFSAGIPTFLSNLALAGWIKFREDSLTAVVISLIMGLSFLLFIVTHLKWSPHLLGKEKDLFKGTAPYTACGLPFDWHLAPQRSKFKQVSTFARSPSPLTTPPQAHNPPAGPNSSIDQSLQNSVSISIPNLGHGDANASGDAGDTSNESETTPLANKMYLQSAGGQQSGKRSGHGPSQNYYTDRRDKARSTSDSIVSTRTHAPSLSQGGSSTRPLLHRQTSAQLILGSLRQSNTSTNPGTSSTSTDGPPSLQSRLYNSVIGSVFGASEQGQDPGDKGRREV